MMDQRQSEFEAAVVVVVVAAVALVRGTNWQHRPAGLGTASVHDC